VQRSMLMLPRLLLQLAPARCLTAAVCATVSAVHAVLGAAASLMADASCCRVLSPDPASLSAGNPKRASAACKAAPKLLLLLVRAKEAAPAPVGGL
jgi:hypothetical protein